MELTFKAPCAELVNLDNLWLQLSNIACNIKCKHCFLDCHQDTKKRNFLPLNKIDETLKCDLKNLKNIYLTGGEPFLHPDFYEIIRKSLAKANVIIHTNGTLINEKKLKIIKSIEGASKHTVSFTLSLDHFTEGRNDEYRARGVFKKVINALLLLQRNNFETSLTCVNLKNEDEDILRDGFIALFSRHGIKMNISDLKIIPMLKIGSYSKYYNISDLKKTVTFNDLKDFNYENLDCKSSRVLTVNGVYSCPALVSDPRGRVGQTLSNSEKKVYLETETCYDCISRKEKLFG